MNINFEKEKDEGNIEYKLHLNNLSDIKIEKYSTQLKYRIIEGKGYAIYIVGIYDNGILNGVKNISNTICQMNNICNKINSFISLILLCNFKNIKILIFKIRANFKLNELPFIY